MAMQKCVALGEEGAACAGADCIGYLGCHDGQCSAGAAAGEPCTGDKDCNNNDVLWCHPDTLTCAERPIGGGCYWEGGTCGYASNCLGDLCHAAPKDGEGCGGASSGTYCIYPAECRNNICTLDYPICSP
jgi:hypothetical protein